MQKIIVHTDGGARGNPGPSGIGVMIRDETGKEISAISKFIGHRTNNFAEYEALIQALDALKETFGAATKEMTIEVRMDSELIVRQITKVYRVKEPVLKVQYARVRELLDGDFRHITFVHVPRAENADADRLANEAMDKGK